MTATKARLAALARGGTKRPRNPRVVLLEHLRAMKRPLWDSLGCIGGYGWAIPTRGVDPALLPENQPERWARVRRMAVWMQDAAIRLEHFAAEQELAALERRNGES